MALIIIASLLTFGILNVQAVRKKADMMSSEQEQWWGPSCSDIIPGSHRRNSAWRRSLDCKCPYHWVVGGDDAVCSEVKGTRYFDDDEKFKVCTCESPSLKDYVSIDHQEPKITVECGVEYGYTAAHYKSGLPDFLENAHEWCNSALVPEEKRIPEKMRGLYWMKDLKLDDVAFCPSLAEWDQETLTARMSVWNMFVFGKKAEEKVSHLAETAASLPVVGGHLVYSIQFTNDTLVEASITTNLGPANGLINFPMWDVQETPDGTVKSEKPGDIFYRWSSIAGFETGTYWAVRIMDDDGTKHADRYSLMQESESKKNTTFQRFKTTCLPERGAQTSLLDKAKRAEENSHELDSDAVAEAGTIEAGRANFTGCEQLCSGNGVNVCRSGTNSAACLGFQNYPCKVPGRFRFNTFPACA